MSDADNFSNRQPINPYYQQELIDYDKARLEHSELRNLLIQSGVNVVTVPSPIDSQDGVYTANWALVKGNKAILARLPKTRSPEEVYAENVLAQLGKQVIHIPEGLKFSGQGDSLACGNTLFCGCGYRSDAEAQKFAANTLGYEYIQLQTVPQLDANGSAIINPTTGWPDSYFYDIDLALAVIKHPTNSQKGLIAYCPEAFIASSREFLATYNDVDKIEVSINEAKNGFATNLISTGETVIMSESAPELAEQLRQNGLQVLTPKITELAKGGGYIRCMTLTIS
jgi:N-dimethylarginine dimethylaminohydrolase